jgi:tetratricopeptide (TPR) repeat protein
MTACLLVAGFASMADNTTGINFFDSGMYNASRVYFLKKLNTISTPAEKAEAYYYLGESYLMLNKQDSARFYFEKGRETLPSDPYNQIGLGGFVLKEDVKKAEAIFKEILSGRLYKKDVNVHVAIARAYMQAGNTAKALEYIESAKKVDRKNGLPYLLEGDLLRAQRQLGEAATKYDHAIHFSPELIGAHVKYANIYMSNNSNRAVSLERLRAVKEFAPDFVGVDRVLGELYEAQGDSKNAVEHYTRFINSGYYDVEHLLMYARLLHFDKQYDKMLPIILPVREKNPDNLVAKRLHAYALAKIEPGEESMNAMKSFLESTPEERHIAQDYLCYAEQLIANNQIAAAIPYYGKMVQKDTSRKAIWATMGDLFMRIGRRDSADHYFALYESTLPSPDLQLIFKRGRNLFSYGVRDTTVQEKREAILRKADSLFLRLSELAPKFVQAYYWRALVYSQLDPETLQGLAKPYFEKVIEAVMESGDVEKYKRELIDCYKYMGYYYYLQAEAITKKHNDNPDFARTEYLKAKEYFTKVLELNPKDAIAIEALQGITIQ